MALCNIQCYIKLSTVSRIPAGEVVSFVSQVIVNVTFFMCLCFSRTLHFTMEIILKENVMITRIYDTKDTLSLKKSPFSVTVVSFFS